jgi:hypothetical protein
MPNWRKWLIESGPIALTALGAFIDALSGRNRPRFEYRVLIKAPREVVWRICTGDHVILHGPPAIDLLTEPLAGGDGLWLTRVAIDRRPPMRVVTRLIEQDAVKGISVRRTVRHALSVPPEGGHDIVDGVTVEVTPYGTVLTVLGEVTVHSLRDRVAYATSFARLAHLMKRQCEHEAGTDSPRASLPPRIAPNKIPAGEPPVMSMRNRAMGLSVAVAIGLLGGVAGSAMLPTAYEREFDQDLSHYPLAASLAQRDPELRKLLLRRTEAAHRFWSRSCSRRSHLERHRSCDFSLQKADPARTYALRAPPLMAFTGRAPPSPSCPRLSRASTSLWRRRQERRGWPGHRRAKRRRSSNGNARP